MISDLIGQRALQEARLAEAAARLEALRAEHAQQVTRLADEAAAERQRLLEEIRLEQERAGGERELLMRQTDRLRQDHMAAVEELRLRVAKLDGVLVSQRQRNEEAEQRASALAASRQQLEDGGRGRASVGWAGGRADPAAGPAGCGCGQAWRAGDADLHAHAAAGPGVATGRGR
jgi:DNA repair exonuclease SbcCD ATPase subunit